MISDFHNISIGNVQKLVTNIFDKEKYVLHWENWQLYLRLGLKLKKIHHVLEYYQSHWLKPYVKFNTQNRIKAKRDGDKDGKALCKLMNNRINVRLVSNKKGFLEWASEPSYMSQKIFDNDVVLICKSKVTLTLNKPAYVGMCTLDLSK